MAFSEMVAKIRIAVDKFEASGDFKALEVEMKRLADTAGKATKPAQDGAKKLGLETKLAAGQVGNLTAQFNDIGMMLMAGQNPLQLAIQQGTQISQVIGPMGAGGAVKALGSALMGMLNPVSLITMGSIAAGAAMIQWLTDSGDAAEGVEDRIKALNEAVGAYAALVKTGNASEKDLAESWGSAAGQARELARSMALIDRDDALKGLEGSADSLAEKFGGLSRTKLVYDGGMMVEAAATIIKIGDAFDLPIEKAGSLVYALEQIDKAGSPEQTIAAANLLGAELIAAFGRAKAIPPELREAAHEAAAVAAAAGKIIALDEAGLRLAEAIRADLDYRLAVQEAIARHGESSVQVERLRADHARAQVAASLEGLNIEQRLKDAILDKWAAEREGARTQTRQDGEADIRAEIAALNDEAAIRAAILKYGKDSETVAVLRLEAERRVVQAATDAKDISETLKVELMAAWDAANGIASVDMAGGISAAASEASRMADEIMRALGAAAQLSMQGAASLAESRTRLDYADDPVGMTGALARQRMLSAQGVRRDGAEGGELAALDAEVLAYVRLNEQIERNNQARLAALRPGGTGGTGGSAGGGAADRNSFAALKAEADRALADLEIAIGAVNEKVRAGLLSVADGQQEVQSAISGTADRVAELIPKLERAMATAGPEGAAKIAELRDALKGLSGDLNETASNLSKTFSDSLGQGLTDFMTGTKSAKDAFSDFAGSVLSEINRIVAQRFTAKFITPLVDNLLSFMPFADGGVPGGAPGLGQWSDSVVDEPIAFAMPGGIGIAGEAGPEAILPMRRGRGGDGVLATDADGRETVLPLQRTGSGALGVSLPAQPGLAAAARPDAGDSGIPIPPALARAMQPEPAVAGGNGAQATAAPGREPLLPGLSALMGVGLPPIPGLAAAAASETGGGSEIRVPPALARAVQPEPAMAGGETGAEAILPLRRGRGGEGVQATDAQGRVTVLPLQRSLSGALSIRLPQIPGLDALRERPEVGGGRPGASAAAMLARPTFFAKGGAVSRMGGGGGAGTAVASGPPAQGQSRAEPARVTVNVTNTAAGTQTQTTERQDGSDRIVDVLIEQIEAGIAANTRRGVGPLSDLMAQTYGLGRQPR